MRSENEQIHYRAKFRLSPYSTTTPSIVDAYRQIYTGCATKRSASAMSRAPLSFIKQ